jgi:hypothetical protein
MAEATSHTTFFSLPTELRLHVASYVLEEQPIKNEYRNGAYWMDPVYWSVSSRNLSILLVSHQFRKDFTSLAWKKTKFTISNDAARIIGAQSDERLKHVRRLGIRATDTHVQGWDMFPFNRESLHLDELDISIARVPEPDESFIVNRLVHMFRCLQNVQKVRLIYTDGIRDPRAKVNRLIGAMLKEDHYKRYDAVNAPNIESTWWDWSWDSDHSCYIFVAREPKPLMEEEDYMLFIKPKVDEVMGLTVCTPEFRNLNPFCVASENASTYMRQDI